MGFSKKLKSLAVASSLLFMTSCTTTILNKHHISDSYNQVKKPKKTYAILVSGAFPDVTPGDNILQDKAVEAYDELKEMGLSDDDIYFLATRREGKKMENTDDLFTYRKFHNACNDLSNKMTEEDALLFIYIGHGSASSINIPIGGAGYTILKNIDEDTEPEEPTNEFYIFVLEAELNRLKSSYKIVVIDACYSGQAAEYLGKKRTISISSTCDDQKSWIFSRFVPYMMKALNGKDEADKNNDKKVSLDEAVEYAAKNDPWSKKGRLWYFFFPTPQIYCEGIDPSKVFLKE
ncbi:caspase family protein [Candidatus Woesearchaeota archaeon]|nr:caspase family protein [Candidatus Woesearchaeota archaeon]